MMMKALTVNHMIRAALIVAAGATAGTLEASAADLGTYVPQAYATEGVDCGGPEVKTFPGVILGHFSGGYSQYPGSGAAIQLDWRDERLCFPTRRSCNRWVSSLRRDYHRPEGYFTCLTIR